MTEPLFAVNFTARVLPVTGGTAKGDALVYDSTQGAWTTATTAARATADSRAGAIALTAYGGSVIGTVSYQSSGSVATEVSGLAATTVGAYRLVRVSSAGRLERITSYTTGDDVVGYAFPDGRVMLHIGLPWDIIASLAIAVTGRKILYGEGTIGGAAHANISADGNITHGASPATQGEDRFSSGNGVYVRGGSDTPADIAVWTHSYDSLSGNSATADNIAVGDPEALGTHSTYAKYFTQVVITDDSGAPQATYGVYGQSYWDNASDSKGFYAGPNLWLRQKTFTDFSLDSDPFGEGVGIVRLDARTTAPTSKPGGCLFLQCNPTTFRLELVSAAAPIENWIPLVDPLVISASPGGGTSTITANDPLNRDVHHAYWDLTGGSANSTYVLPNVKGTSVYIRNNTSWQVTFKVSGQTGVTFNSFETGRIYCNGTDYKREGTF